MQTLIELYDDRPLENVISTQFFTPERTVFICEKEIADDPRRRQQIENYFCHCGVSSEVIMLAADRYSASALLDTLKYAAERFPGCVLDITGGTDQALFAAGVLFAEKLIPAFTWSRKSNTFYSIGGAPFEGPLKNRLRLSIEDYFILAGGSVRRGRVDNSILSRYMKFFKPFFDVYLRYRTEWKTMVNWMQRVSANDGREVKLNIDTPITVGTEHGVVSINTKMLEDLRGIGFIKGLVIDSERVNFRFRDAQVRTWLRDIGSVLETYIYKVCLDTGIFSDVATSVIVDWESGVRENSVSNEIDVMAARGVTPLFISCKTCEIRTEALNELSILKERFGGKMAKAAIVTATKVQTVTRRRAHELGIDVIDLEDLRTGRAAERIRETVM